MIGASVRITILFIFLSPHSSKEKLAWAAGKPQAELDFFVQGVRLGYGDYQVARPAAGASGANAPAGPR